MKAHIRVHKSVVADKQAFAGRIRNTVRSMAKPDKPENYSAHVEMGQIVNGRAYDIFITISKK